MKKQLLLLLIMFLPIMAWAETVEIDGIYYELNTDAKTAGVTSNPNYYSDSVVIPEKVKHEGTEYSVTSIGYLAFRDCSGLTSITIPNSVTSIGEDAFECCSGLTSITIPNSVTIIESGIFCGCTGLTSFTISDNVKSIGNYAFGACSGLTSITIPNSVTSIGDFAFCDCSGLTSITIPNSVTRIGYGAFQGCANLTSITIPNSVTSIGSNAFSLSPWYENQPNGLVYAGKVAYKYKGWMPKNTSIIIEDGTLGIAGSAFDSCSGLTSIIIPNSVKSIGDWAFSNCYGLTTITIPNSVTSIEYCAFASCKGLTSVNIPNSVTSIGDYAFSYCTGLTSVSIPYNMTSIGEGAFEKCSSLLDMFCFADNIPQTESNTFESSNIADATLHVPAGSVGAYQTTEPWNQFKTIVPLSNQEVSINGMNSENKKETVRYTIGGIRTLLPKKGLNIVRMSDGTTKKVLK